MSLYDETIQDEQQPSLYNQVNAGQAITQQPQMSVWDAINVLSKKKSDIAKNALIGGARGLRDIVDSSAYLLARGMEAAAPEGSATEAFFRKERKKVELVNKKAEESYQNMVGEQPFFAEAGRMFGDAATMMIPGLGQRSGAQLVNKLWNAGKLGKVAATGLSGLLGAEQAVLTGPKTGEESIAQQAGIGAAVGAVMKPGMAVASAIANPKWRPAVEKLLKEKVPLTIGQIVGGGAHTLEQAGQSIPGLGDLIRNRSREAAVTGLTKAAINRVLSPSGLKIPEKLPDDINPVAWAGDKLSDKYTDILKNIGGKLDSKLNVELQTVLRMGKYLPKDLGNTLKGIYEDEIKGRFTNYGIASGESINEMDSSLGQIYRQYQRLYNTNADPAILKMRDAVKEMQASIRRMLERQNPKYSDELKGIRKAWSNLVVVEDAAGRAGAPAGYLSPSALEAAVKSQARKTSVRGRAFARGEASMQDLSDAAVAVMGKTVPDSGTPMRAMTAYTLANIPKLATSPFVWGLGGLGSTMYSPWGGAIGRGLLTSRPDIMRGLGDTLQNMPPYIYNAITNNMIRGQQ